MKSVTLGTYMNDFTNWMMAAPVDAPKAFRLVYYWPGDDYLDTHDSMSDDYALLYQSTVNPDVFISVDAPSMQIRVYTRKDLSVWKNLMTTKFALRFLLGAATDDEYDQWLEDLQFTVENL